MTTHSQHFQFEIRNVKLGFGLVELRFNGMVLRLSSLVLECVLFFKENTSEAGFFLLLSI